MKNAKGRGVIRVGDRTSHGGQVISGGATFKVLGKDVAADGDWTFCPQCRGIFAIWVAKSERKHHGKRLAYEGDETACGAALISSVQ